MGARVKKTARERLEEMRMVDSGGAQGATNVEEPIHENGDHPSLVPPQRAPQGRRRKSAPTQRDGPDRKRVTVKDRKEHFLTRNQTWKHQDQHVGPPPAGLSHIQHQQLMGQPLSVPMTMLQSGNTNGAYATVSHQAWPGAHTSPSQVLEQVVHSLPGYAATMAAQRNGPVTLPAHGMTSPPTANNAAVAATLAALGIQLPMKRVADAAVAASPAQSPTMTLDQLRRRIALRETSSGPMPFPSNYQGLVSQALLSGVQSAESHQPASIATQMVSPHRTGNVLNSANGTAGAPKDAHFQLGGAFLPAQMAVPNPYHGPPTVGGHGPQCS